MRIFYRTQKTWAIASIFFASFLEGTSQRVFRTPRADILLLIFETRDLQSFLDFIYKDPCFPNFSTLKIDFSFGQSPGVKLVSHTFCCASSCRIDTEAGELRMAARKTRNTRPTIVNKESDISSKSLSEIISMEPRRSRKRGTLKLCCSPKPSRTT